MEQLAVIIGTGLSSAPFWAGREEFDASTVYKNLQVRASN